MLSMSFDFSETNTSRPGSLNGGGRSSTALTMLKIAAFAPMPSASVSTATAVKPGFFSSWRKANFKSLITQRLHWINLGRTAGRNPARQKRHSSEQHRYSEQGARVSWLHSEKERPENTPQR